MQLTWGGVWGGKGKGGVIILYWLSSNFESVLYVHTGENCEES